MTMNYGVGWKIWIFHFQQKMLCYDFFSVKKHLEAHRGLGFGHTFCFSK